MDVVSSVGNARRGLFLVGVWTTDVIGAESMPDRETVDRARQDAREGKAASTQAGEFVREEIHHVREGKHGARSTKQAIAIGLSKARRAGVKLPRKGTAAKRPSRGRKRGKPSATRSRAVRKALKREGRKAATRRSLSRQAKSAARRRSGPQRSAAARKAARTKGRTGRSTAARKAARTRARRR
jgi:hypothetical protein